MSLLCAPAVAGDMAVQIDFPDETPLRNRVFFFGGADVGRDSYFAWSGFVGAPQGLLHEDGPRFRITGGAGHYVYRTLVTPEGTNEGLVTSGELMFGFRRTYGPTVFTAFVGGHAENQRLFAPDPYHAAQGTDVGIKADVDLFARLSPNWFATTNVTVSTVHRGYRARAAITREHPAGMAFGFETLVQGDARYVEPRAGVFAHATVRRAVIALAGGYLSNSDKGGGAYITLSIYAPY